MTIIGDRYGIFKEIEDKNDIFKQGLPIGEVLKKLIEQYDEESLKKKFEEQLKRRYCDFLEFNNMKKSESQETVNDSKIAGSISSKRYKRLHKILLKTKYSHYNNQDGMNKILIFCCQSIRYFLFI